MNNYAGSVRLETSLKANSIFCIGDTHFPYTDSKKLDKILKLIKELKPQVIVQIGDIYDLNTFSRFSRSVNFITPKEELEKGKKMAVEMWEKIHKIVPNAKLYQLRGNHCLRIWKKIMDKLPEYESVVGEFIEDLFKFKNVTTLPTSHSELVINDIVFIHGWKIVLGDHIRWFGQSVVCGHSHHGGIVFKRTKNLPLFELNCGHIADESQTPLMYGETKTNSWIAGCGFIDKYGPRFIPL